MRSQDCTTKRSPRVRPHRADTRRATSLSRRGRLSRQHGGQRDSHQRDRCGPDRTSAAEAITIVKAARERSHVRGNAADPARVKAQARQHRLPVRCQYTGKAGLTVRAAAAGTPGACPAPSCCRHSGSLRDRGMAVAARPPLRSTASAPQGQLHRLWRRVRDPLPGLCSAGRPLAAGRLGVSPPPGGPGAGLVHASVAASLGAGSSHSQSRC